MEKFELVKPSTSLINQYWTIYNKSDQGEPDDYTVPLFEDMDPVDLREKNYLSKKNFAHKKDDVDIRNFLYNHDMKRFLEKLNAAYSTRVRNLDVLVNDCHWWYRQNERTVPTMDLDNFVRYCKNDLKMGYYPYSFATKIYSFLDPEKYPILDSYSATLLNEYLKEPDDERNEQRKRWGCYKHYKADYDKFREKYSLSDDLTYKQIDVFLWTYATVLSEYWKQMGVLEFKSVEFKPGKK